jgi:hypothetical protein
MTQNHPRGFSETLSTKRGSISGVRRGAPTAYLSDIRCSRVLPLDSTAQQEAYARGVSVDLQVFCDVADIIAEDRVIVDSVEYVAVEVSHWQMTGRELMQVMLRLYQG